MKAGKTKVLQRFQDNLKKEGLMPYTSLEAQKIFDTCFATIVDFLKEGNEVALPNEIGKFSLDFRRPRKIPDSFLARAKGTPKHTHTREYVNIKYSSSKKICDELTNTPLLRGKFPKLDTVSLLKEFT